MKYDLDYVADILLAATDIGEFLTGVSMEKFSTDKLIRSAVMRQLEIMSEATKRLSTEFRAEHTSVPWKRIAGLRDRLIHAYDDLDLEYAWEAATVALPKVRAYLEILLPNYKKEQDN